MAIRKKRILDWSETDLADDVAKLEASDANAASATADVNLRLEHLSKRMDEAENLLKRIYDHLSQFHRI